MGIDFFAELLTNGNAAKVIAKADQLIAEYAIQPGDEAAKADLIVAALVDMTEGLELNPQLKQTPYLGEQLGTVLDFWNIDGITPDLRAGWLRWLVENRKTALAAQGLI